MSSLVGRERFLERGRERVGDVVRSARRHPERLQGVARRFPVMELKMCFCSSLKWSRTSPHGGFAQHIRPDLPGSEAAQHTHEAGLQPAGVFEREAIARSWAGWCC